MTRAEAVILTNAALDEARSAFGLDNYVITPVDGHNGGRNIVYFCVRPGDKDYLLRFSYLPDRSYEDLLAETEFVDYLVKGGARVAAPVPAKSGALVAKIAGMFACLFEKAPGRQLAENGYKYIEGASLSDYHYICGKTLGRIHALSKEYSPVHRRVDFFDRFAPQHIDKLFPQTLRPLKDKLNSIVARLNELPKTNANYGLLHFDFSDGNYNVNYDNGELTVYDFDNACYGFYMHDLAELWTHLSGWTMFEKNPDKRWENMNGYFAEILRGYASETDIDEDMLKLLPLFIDATMVESLVDEFEVKAREDEAPELDEESGFLAECLLQDIPYQGFFSDIYSCEAPFCLKP